MATMQITVRLFAILKDRAGVAALELSVSDGATIADAEASLIALHPNLRDPLARSAFAVNREYALRTASLKPGDELAIIPPVSGG